MIKMKKKKKISLEKSIIEFLKKLTRCEHTGWMASDDSVIDLERAIKKNGK